MATGLYKKGIVLGIVMLFIGTGVTPRITGENSSGWSITEVVSIGSNVYSEYPSLAVDTWKTVHVVWADQRDIYYNYKLDGGYWNTPELVSTESDSPALYPSLAVDSSGTVHIAWQDSTIYGVDDIGKDFDIFYKYKPRAGSWSITEIVSTESNTYASMPSLAVDLGGTVHVSWYDHENDYGGSGSDYDVFYKYRPSGGGWSITEVVSSESSYTSENPSLAVDSSGTVHIAWQDLTDYGGSGTDGDIFYKYKPRAGSWSITEIVSSNSLLGSGSVFLTVGLDGTVHAAWDDCTLGGGPGSDWDIYYNYKPSGGTWDVTEGVCVGKNVKSMLPSLAVDIMGTVHVVWYAVGYCLGIGNVHDILYKCKPNCCSWKPAEIVSTENAFGCFPCIGTGFDGVAHVAWTSGGDYDGSGTEGDIFYKKKTDLPPICDIKLKNYGFPVISVDVEEFFDICISDSTDNGCVREARFSSDDFQDDNPTGTWTQWYNWDTSSGDWNADNKIKRWAFATDETKEVWVEVKDNIGQTSRCSANIYANLRDDIIDQRQVIQESNLPTWYPNMLAQSFKPSFDILTRVKFLTTGRQGDPNSNIIVSIRESLYDYDINMISC